jgi:cupin fold WbuC family metalloprotein
LLIPIDEALIEQVRQQAQVSPRRRAIHRFHSHPDPVQRMLNAVEPDSYVMPHKHENPDKVEAFIILKGRAVLFSFDESGTPTGCVLLEEGTTRLGVEVPPRTWHSLAALESGTVLYEVLEGPYLEETHKTFAVWAPPANDFEAGLAWVQCLKEHFGIG